MKIGKRIRLASALALCGVFLVSSFTETAQAARSAVIAETGVHVRDPFILEYRGTYYMYGTGLQWDGYGCVYGKDLRNWSEPVRVYTPQGKCDGENDWWAPECHLYKGAFYLFATYRAAASGKRGVGVFRADDPLGPFEIISDGHITPKTRDAIDGTLYVDDDGQPWMVYVGEWTSTEDGVGDMMAAKLSDDLTRFISEPVLLFRASDAGRKAGFVTDGPFLYKTKEGRLLMLWSNNSRKGYCVWIASSADGRVDGKWRLLPGALYEGSRRRPDGGHGMLFTAPDGTLTMAIHSPNAGTEETPEQAILIPVADIGVTLVPKEKDRFLVRAFYRCRDELRQMGDHLAEILGLQK